MPEVGLFPDLLLLIGLVVPIVGRHLRGIDDLVTLGATDVVGRENRGVARPPESSARFEHGDD